MMAGKTRFAEKY